MPPFLAALLPGVGSMISSIVGGLFSSSSENRRYEEQRALMYEQNSLQRDFWRENNEYNTPSAQMRRYKSAGVNPYMAISSPNTSTYGSVVASTPQVPDKAPIIMRTVDGLMRAFMMKAQVDNLNSDTHLKESQVGVQEGLALLQNVQRMKLLSEKDLVDFTNQWRRVTASVEYNTLVANFNLLRQRTDNSAVEYKILGQKYLLTREEVENAKQTRELLKSQTKLNESNIDLVIANAIGVRISNTMQSARIPYAASLARSEDGYSFERWQHEQSQTDLTTSTLPSIVKSSEFRSKSAEEQLRLLLRYGEYQSAAGILGSALGGSGSVLGGTGSLINSLK